MRTVIVLALGLLVTNCGRRNFNDDASVDSPPGDAQACTVPATGCADGTAYTCGGVCYLFCSNQLSRPAAATTCEDWGGCLATIDSLPANNCAAKEVSIPAWIGALQDNNSIDPHSSWRWCTNALIVFDRWGQGSPDDDDGIENGQDQCAVINQGGDWSDEICGTLRPFTCSRPL